MNNRQIEDERQILRVFRYCRSHSVELFARSEELLCMDLGLVLLAIRPLHVPAQLFAGHPRRELCLQTIVHSTSHDLSIPLPGRNFTISFQHRTIRHSFQCCLYRYIPRLRTAILSFPERIYEHYLRSSLRAPVVPSDSIRLCAQNGMLIEVVNLTVDGMAAIVPDEISVRVGQVTPPFFIIINECRFPVTGRIRHITPISPGRRLCGFSLEYVDPDVHRRLQEFILKKQLCLAGISSDSD